MHNLVHKAHGASTAHVRLVVGELYNNVADGTLERRSLEGDGAVDEATDNVLDGCKRLVRVRGAVDGEGDVSRLVVAADGDAVCEAATAGGFPEGAFGDAEVGERNHEGWHQRVVEADGAERGVETEAGVDGGDGDDVGVVTGLAAGWGEAL